MNTRARAITRAIVRANKAVAAAAPSSPIDTPEAIALAGRFQELRREGMRTLVDLTVALGQILIDSELITEEDLADALARQFELDRATLERASFDPSTVALLPRGVAETLGALPMSRTGDVVMVVVSDPSQDDLDLLIEDEIDHKVRLAVASRAELEVAIERTRAVHADQRRTDTTTLFSSGASVTERWVPVERVGLYVPGGNAVYPSSVVMNVVPAQAAGVDSLVVASPPQAQRTRGSSSS